jgi:RecG-like helicase
MISIKTHLPLTHLSTKRVIKEIRTDMGTNAQMNRLLQAM